MNYSQLIRYTVIGGVILIVGTQLLASVLEVVNALRFGDFLPFLSVVTFAILIVRFTRNMETETPLHILLNLLAWTATGYLMVLAFTLTISFGLVIALVSCGATAIALEQLRDPIDIQRLGRILIPFSSKFARVLAYKVLNSKRFTEGISLWIVPQKHSSAIVDLIRKRPMLPIALTHFQDEDILSINAHKISPTLNEVKELFSSNGVPRLERASPLLTWVVLNMLVFELDGSEPTHLRDCCLIHDKSTLEMVLSNWPLGGTLFSTPEGTMMMVESKSVVGFNSTTIPKGFEPWVLVKHDMSMLNLEGA